MVNVGDGAGGSTDLDRNGRRKKETERATHHCRAGTRSARIMRRSQGRVRLVTRHFWQSGGVIKSESSYEYVSEPRAVATGPGYAVVPTACARVRAGPDTGRPDFRDGEGPKWSAGSRCIGGGNGFGNREDLQCQVR